MTPALCLETFFTDRPFLQRMEAASRLGFRDVVFWSWKDKNIEGIRRASRRLNLRIAAFSGNRSFTLIQPGERDGLLEEMRQALRVSRRLGCPSLNLLSDRLLKDGRAALLKERLRPVEKMDCLVETLKALAGLAQKAGVTLLLEPLNTKVDHPGCFLDSFGKALEAVRRVGHPSVRILYDVYHMSVMKEDVLGQLRNHLSWIGRLDVADAPGRHEPGTGRIDYPAIVRLLRRLRYRRGVSLELFPAGDPEAAAAKALKLLRS